MKRKATRSGLKVHRQMLTEQTRAVLHLINSSKFSYYQEKLTTADSKKTFRIISSVVIYTAGNPLPTATSDQPEPKIFCNSFTTKFKRSDGVSMPQVSTTLHLLQTWTVQCLTLDTSRSRRRKKLEKVIRGCAYKTCSLDAIPTALLKNSAILSVVLPNITELVNTSLSTGVFLNDLKRALVTPRLKKPGLDKAFWVSIDQFQNPIPQQGNRTCVSYSVEHKLRVWVRKIFHNFGSRKSRLNQSESFKIPDRWIMFLSPGALWSRIMLFSK